MSLMTFQFDSKDKVLEVDTVDFVETELRINLKINKDILPITRKRNLQNKTSSAKLNLSNICTTPDAIMKYVRL